MVEYLHDAIRAIVNQDIEINAFIAENDGTSIKDNCKLVLYDKDRDTMLGQWSGEYIADLDMWYFRIPAFDTIGLKGRYWYCIQHKDSNMCFKQPLYLV